MARSAKKRKPKFEKGAEARRLARAQLGPPPSERIIPDRRAKPVKHKKSILEDQEV